MPLQRLERYFRLSVVSYPQSFWSLCTWERRREMREWVSGWGEFSVSERGERYVVWREGLRREREREREDEGRKVPVRAPARSLFGWDRRETPVTNVLFSRLLGCVCSLLVLLALALLLLLENGINVETLSLLSPSRSVLLLLRWESIPGVGHVEDGGGGGSGGGGGGGGGGAAGVHAQEANDVGQEGVRFTFLHFASFLYLWPTVRNPPPPAPPSTFNPLLCKAWRC